MFDLCTFVTKKMPGIYNEYIVEPTDFSVDLLTRNRKERFWNLTCGRSLWIFETGQLWQTNLGDCSYIHHHVPVSWKSPLIRSLSSYTALSTQDSTDIFTERLASRGNLALKISVRYFCHLPDVSTISDGQKMQKWHSQTSFRKSLLQWDGVQ